MGDITSARRVLVEKPKGMKSLRRPRRR